MSKQRKSNEQLFEEAERAAVLEAVQETEQEIFDDVLNRDPNDNDGDRSLEDMEDEEGLDGDTEDEEDEGDGEEAGEEEGEEGEEGEGEEPPQTRHDDADRRDDRRGVPSSRLREEAQRRTAAEGRERDLQSKLDQALGRLEALERGQQRQPPRQERQEPPAAPDMFADPEGWAKHQRDTITQEFEEKRINASFEDARDQHGDKFVSAFQDLQKTGNPNLVREIVGSHNPGKALMNWHSRQSLMADIGNDPAAYRQRMREELLADPEFRQEIVNTLRGEARGSVARQIERGQRETRSMPSLNSATGGTSHRGSTSRDTARTNRSVEREIFDFAFED